MGKEVNREKIDPPKFKRYFPIKEQTKKGDDFLLIKLKGGII